VHKSAVTVVNFFNLLSAHYKYIKVKIKLITILLHNVNTLPQKKKLVKIMIF